MEPKMLSFLNLKKTQHEQYNRMKNQLTLNAFFDEHYFPHAKVTKRQPHHDWSIYNKHMRASMGSYFLDDLTNPILDIWVREQLLASYQRSTINKHINLMNHLLNLARHWGHILTRSQYQQNIKKLPVGDFTQRFLSEAEIDTLLQSCRTNSHPFLYLIVQLLLLTGARKGEARLACWKYIDLHKRIWLVPRSKNGRSRRIILSAGAVDVLHAARKKSDELGLPSKPGDFVFTNPTTRTAYHSYDTAWMKARGAAGLPEVRMHDLRHTFASILINKGVSLYEVQTLLGHSSLQMTQRYAHLAPDLLHMRAEMVGTILSKINL